MKKLLIISIAIISSILMLSKVQAVCSDTDTKCQGFEQIPDLKLCQPGMSMGENAYNVELNAAPASEVNSKMTSVCKKNSMMGSFSVSYLGLHVFGSAPSFIGICANGNHTPKKDDGSYLDAGPVNVLAWYCCPADYPYDGGWNAKLCSDKPGGSGTVNGIEGDSVMMAGAPNDKWKVANGYIGDSNPYLENAKLSAYVCNEGCTVSTFGPGASIVSNLFRKPVTISQIGTAFCVPNGTNVSQDSCMLAPGKAGDSCICHNGGGVSKYLLDTVGEAGIAIIDQCGGGPSNQVQDCVSCLMKSLVDTGGNTTPYYQWSAALGCVDTRLNAFITRLIQIGMGVGSGIAVIRIIQGAFYRQSNDPSKIQEGNEILFSTFLGLGVLIGAVLILRIIGVDVLGIFTAGQFTSIINN